jgi:glycogen operon protein
MIALRREHPIFRRRHFFTGEAAGGSATKDIVWLKPDGIEMTPEEWAKDFARCLGVYLAGDALAETDRVARPVRDASFLMLFNAHHDAIPFMLPALGPIKGWYAQFDTALENGTPAGSTTPAGTEYPLQGRSLVLLVQAAHPA